MVQPKRSMHAGPNAQSDEDRRIWQFFTVDQRWVCPYCRGAYKVQQNTAQGIRSLIQHHLQRQCTAHQGGQGRQHSITEMQHQVHLYNVEFFARNDRAWQVFDHEGYWFSPCSLQRVDTVKLNNRRFDANTVQRMAEHLLTCPYYRQGTVHKVEEVQQARDLHAKVISLSRNLQKVIGQKIWQHIDGQRQWVCPYCLDHGPWLVVQGGQEWNTYTPLMAHHLLTSCQVYATNPRGIRSEKEVAAAAGGTGVMHGFGGRSPSNPALQIMPMQNDNTPLQTMTLSPITQKLNTPPKGEPRIEAPQATPHTRPNPILPPIGQAGDGGLPPLPLPNPSAPGTAAFLPGTAPHTPATGQQVSGSTPISGGQQVTTGRTPVPPSAKVIKRGLGPITPKSSEALEPTIKQPPKDESGTRPTIARPIHPSNIRRDTSGAEPTVSTGRHKIPGDDEPRIAQPMQPATGSQAKPAPTDEELEDNLGWMADSNHDTDDDGLAGLAPNDPTPVDPTLAEEPLAEGQEHRTPSDDLAWMDGIEEELHNTNSHRQNSQELNTEMIRAADVQKNMLKECPELEGYSFATRYEPAADVSGDFYEFIELPDGRIGFAMGDVSGHGMGAGLIMSMAKKVFSIYARMGESPSRVLSQVNDALVEDLGGKRFVSITYAILDPDARTITWARAGHNPTLTVNINTGAYREIKPPGMVVGMKGGPLFANSLQLEVTELQPGDVFLVYTDGITETMNRQGDEYGTERLEQLLTDHGDKDIGHLLDRIMDSARQFRGGGVTEDDITLLGLAVD